MGTKVSFDEINKIVNITQAPDVNNEVNLDVKIDLYSDGKEDWVNNENLRKYPFPIRAVGGNPLPGSRQLGSTFFLDSEWKIRPYEANHRLLINGNLYSEDGTSVFTNTLGMWSIFIEQQVSSLVDSTIQQLPEIEYSSFNGGVTVDVVNGTAGTTFPTGTPQQPCSNITDAHTIATDRGFDTFYIRGTLTLDGTEPSMDSHVFIGESPTRTTITISAASQVSNSEFQDCQISGTLDGNNKLVQCMIGDLIYFNGFLYQCLLITGTITLGGSADAVIMDCWSETHGANRAKIDMGGSGQNLTIHNYNGEIELFNKTGTEEAEINLAAGQVFIDSTVTAGNILLRGIGSFVDQSTGTTTIDSTDLIQAAQIYDVYNYLGLEEGDPVTVTPTQRKTNRLTLNIMGDGVTTNTVTRQ